MLSHSIIIISADDVTKTHLVTQLFIVPVVENDIIAFFSLDASHDPHFFRCCCTRECKDFEVISQKLLPEITRLKVSLIGPMNISIVRNTGSSKCDSIGASVEYQFVILLPLL